VRWSLCTRRVGRLVLLGALVVVRVCQSVLLWFLVAPLVAVVSCLVFVVRALPVPSLLVSRSAAGCFGFVFVVCGVCVFSLWSFLFLCFFVVWLLVGGRCKRVISLASLVGFVYLVCFVFGLGCRWLAGCCLVLLLVRKKSFTPAYPGIRL
jgi:hypothetical protein